MKKATFIVLLCSSPALAQLSGTAFSGSVGIPAASVFTLPAPNACQSNYDQYYEAEPGVYDYWPLCEKSGYEYDYVGFAHYTSNFASGAGITQGAAGPVNDGETAISFTNAGSTSGLSNQFVTLNTNGGTIAAWIKSAVNDAGDEVAFPATIGNSRVALGVCGSGCFRAQWTNSGNTVYTVQANATAGAWHRVAMTWAGGTETLYIDGASVGTAAYTGTLNNQVAYFQLLFAGYASGQTVGMGKVALANQAWTAAQVAADFAPTVPTPPTGGLLVTAQRLGTVHRDVLGFGESGADLSTTTKLAPLTAGLAAAGVTAVRLGGGNGGGIEADLSSWQGGTVECTPTSGTTKPAPNVSTLNTLDNFMQQVAIPLSLHVGYTVNYGTNTPTCNGPGDPVANGQNLIAYAKSKNYGLHYIEIGNELYNAGSSETDYHSGTQADGANFAIYEPAFYNDMKGADSSILVAFPIATSLYSWTQTWSLAAMASALYDAVVFHDYPVNSPITDGNTLYPERVASNMQNARGQLLSIQTNLLNFGKNPQAIWVTEWDGEIAGNKWSHQTLGAIEPLFAAAELGLYTQVGVNYATWWSQGGSNYCNQYNYDYNGESAYSWLGQCGGTHLVYTVPGQVGDVPVGMTPGSLSPVGQVFSLISASGYVTEGETSLKSFPDVSGAPWLAAYAATHGTGYAVMLINRDRDASHVVPVQIAGKTSGAAITTYEYGKSQYDATGFKNWSAPYTKATVSAWNGAASIPLPPWSVTVAIIQ